MSDERLPDDLRALIAQERATPALSSEASARIAERLASTLALPPLPAPPPTASSVLGSSTRSAASHAPSAITTASAWTAGKLVPIALAFVLGGATGAVITARVMESTPARTAPIEQAQPRVAPVAPIVKPERVPVERAPASPGVEPPMPSDVAPLASKPEATAPERVETDRELRAERELIALARRALAQGHADDALAALERHDRRFPKGRLAEERDSLRVPALVMLGRRNDAAERAAQFRTRHPNSLFAPVVDSALHSAPPETNP
jgi:hypothetical protein